MVFKLLFILSAFPKAIHDLLNKNSLITILLVFTSIGKKCFLSAKYASYCIQNRVFHLNFLNKYQQICRTLKIRKHLLKKSWMEIFIFLAVSIAWLSWSYHLRKFFENEFCWCNFQAPAALSETAIFLYIYQISSPRKIIASWDRKRVLTKVKVSNFQFDKEM